MRSRCPVLDGRSDAWNTDTSSLFILRFRLSEIFGFVADFGSTFTAVPDLAAMLKRRSSAGMNTRMAAIMGAIQGPLGVLRFVDCFATSDRVAHSCSMDQSPERRRSRHGADSAAVRASYADKQNDSLHSDLGAYSRACQLSDSKGTQEDRSALMPWVEGIPFTSCYDVPLVLLWPA